MPDLYDELGVPKDATPEDIKRAHRKGVRQNHPDVHPGDEAKAERFGALQRAYETLRDPKRRSRYDETGDTGERSAERENAELMTVVMGTLQAVLNSPEDLDHQDIGDLLKRHLMEVRRQIEAKRTEMEKRKARSDKMLKRFRLKRGKKGGAEGAGLLRTALEQSGRSLVLEIEKINDALDTHLKVTAIFAAYDYQFDIPEPAEGGFYRAAFNASAESLIDQINRAAHDAHRRGF